MAPHLGEWPLDGRLVVCPPRSRRSRPPRPGRAAGSVERVTGAEDTGTGEHEGHASDVEATLPRHPSAADIPATSDAWQPHAPPPDLRQAESSPVTAAAASPEAPSAPSDGLTAAASSEALPVTAPWGVPGPIGPERSNGAGPQQRYEAGDPAHNPPGGQGFSSPGWGPSPTPAGHAGIFGPPLPPRAPHRWGLGAYFLVEAVFLLVSALLAYALDGRLTASAGAVALALSVPTVCAAALAALITQIRGNGPRIDFGLSMTRRDVVVGVACGFAGLVITIPASVLYVAIVGADATSAVGEALGAVRAGPVLAVTIFVIVVFVAPLCEEIVYRGLLWGAVERLGANRWWALGVTTFVFALAHFEFSRTPLLLVVAVPIGIARVITGRLPAGVIAHQINNLLPGLVLMLGLLGVVPMT